MGNAWRSRPSHVHAAPTSGTDGATAGSYAGPTMAISVNAHITGTVWNIDVKVGDAVAEGETGRHPRVDEDGDARRVTSRRQGDRHPGEGGRPDSEEGAPIVELAPA